MWCSSLNEWNGSSSPASKVVMLAVYWNIFLRLLLKHERLWGYLKLEWPTPTRILQLCKEAPPGARDFEGSSQILQSYVFAGSKLTLSFLRKPNTLDFHSKKFYRWTKTDRSLSSQSTHIKFLEQYHFPYLIVMLKYSVLLNRSKQILEGAIWSISSGDNLDDFVGRFLRA